VSIPPVLEQMGDKPKTVKFDRAKRERLRKAYNDAKDRVEVFAFEGDDYFVGYAKYLLEHLDNVLGK
jgi:hypothetical protein